MTFDIEVWWRTTPGVHEYVVGCNCKADPSCPGACRWERCELHCRLPTYHFPSDTTACKIWGGNYGFEHSWRQNRACHLEEIDAGRAIGERSDPPPPPWCVVFWSLEVTNIKNPSPWPPLIWLFVRWDKLYPLHYSNLASWSHAEWC